MERGKTLIFFVSVIIIVLTDKCNVLGEQLKLFQDSSLKIELNISIEKQEPSSAQWKQTIASFEEHEADKISEYLSRERMHTDLLASQITCDICEEGVKLLRGLILKKKPREVIEKAMVFLCIFFKVEDERMCHMVFNEFRDEVFYVAEKLAMKPAEACGIFLSQECGGKYYPGEMWNITFPDVPKPKPKPPTPPKPTAPKLRILHLSDIHIDYQYTEGAKVDCGELLCCRDNDGKFSLSTEDLRSTSMKTDGAGKWGHYGNCDIPRVLATNLFKHLNSRQNDFDFVIFTGDVPAHDIWNQTKTDQLNHIAYLDSLFNKYLPEKPVYWAIGNHEGAPCNSFPPPGIPGHTMNWLYDRVSQLWSKWLPTAALADVRRCGMYSFSPYSGFRIISINDNYCNKENLWLLLNATDPCGTLQWLVDELQKAENKNEKVYILTHIPPGEKSCLKPWSYNYYKVINRYENTIVNQFFGHNHEDWFQMFYDEGTFQRPVGFGFVMPAVSAVSGGNPVYRIYTIDGNYEGSSWAVLNYTNYFFNLTKANEKGDPEWTYAYSPMEAYDMEALYANDWEDLLQRLEKDDDLLQKFHLNYWNRHDHGRCDEKCKEKLTCDIKEGRSYDPNLCKIHK